ncbi:aldo/keto reductase [Saccharopolyspora phatthalungensis]|uniref:Aryl-alcohol dehydrogenase-like predicted oxidoreductase n=1 Tax=Saccharopolyspora phatthalungensis TaxID=664693 RepID=A0A840QGP1_9PSEU|nr:aldo/keto reductase [Saccharopolyspora phatthalungensis]MBB5159656.1 aryl-alcohol dehydrogenase-like predicted oxidoreductase [Saccharopolyspora phatthalungensis]
MPGMQRRFLRGLDAEVSLLGAGCWTVGGPATNRGVPIGWDHVDPEQAYDGLVRARELGVTLFDTADVYGCVQSERLLGRLLRETGRTGLVISSKVGYFAGTARHPYAPDQMRRQFATTLDNLGTDHLDIYFLHSSDFGENDQYLAGAVEVMGELREQGLIRAIGTRGPHAFAEQWATGDDARAATTTRWSHLFDQIRPNVVTVRYNLLSPLYTSRETDIFAFARRHLVGVLIKQALGQGLLLRDPASPPPVFSPADHRCRDPRFQPTVLAALDRMLAALRDWFGTDPTELARIALRYVLQHAPDAAVLAGFRDANQITTTLTCLGNPLGQDEIDQIIELFHPRTDGNTDERTPARAVHRD